MKTHTKQIFSIDFIKRLCGIINDQVIGTFVMKDHLITDNYHSFLQEELSPLMENVPVANRVQMWIQQYCAPAHFDRRVTSFLNT